MDYRLETERVADGVKRSVKNKDLWMQLDELVSRLSVDEMGKGHAGIHYNEVCDQLTQHEIALHR